MLRKRVRSHQFTNKQNPELRVVLHGRDARATRNAIHGELALAGFFSISSKCVKALGLSLSDFTVMAARASVASFRTVEFAGDGLASALVIACSKAVAASSLFPESKEARP